MLADMALALNQQHDDETRPDPKNLHENWNMFDVYVCEQNNVIIGFVSGCLTYNFHMGWKRYEIRSLYVIPQTRRLGVAEALIKKLVQDQYQDGVGFFALEVHEDNKGAVSFYNDIGFKKRPRDHDKYAIYGDDIRKLLENK